MKKKSLSKILATGSLAFIIGIFSLAYWHRANSPSYEVYSAVKTVEMFFKLNEKGDTVAMREFVTNTPSIFLDQMVAKEKRNAPIEEKMSRKR